MKVERKPTGNRETYVYVVWLLCTGALAFVAVHQMVEAQRLRGEFVECSANVERFSATAFALEKVRSEQAAKFRACEQQVNFCDDNLAKCELGLVAP